MGLVVLVGTGQAQDRRSGCSAPSTEWDDAQARSPRAPNPLKGLPWFIDKEWGVPYQKYRQASGDKKRLIGKIALHPQFKWFGAWDVRKYGSAGTAVRQYLERIACTSPGAVAQVAPFFHEGSNCDNRNQGGGRAEDVRFRRNLRSFAEGLGNHRVVVAYEPDSLGTVDCLAPARRRARIRNLAYGIEQLSRVPNATVYIEAGAADWMPVGKTAKLLRAVGVRRVRGFMLNATHMVTSRASIRYGRAVSKRVGGKHFIVNTSDNGNGPLYRYVRGFRYTVWCNPPNSALGRPATTRTGSRLADAFLWVNRPGTSHGSCNGGPLPVGSWWEKRALTMARRARF